MIPAATITTERLQLRQPTETDAPAIAAAANDERIARMTLRLPYPYTIDDARKWIAMVADGLATGNACMALITLREGGAVAGAVGLEINTDHQRAELGYWIAREHRNQGYATEASVALVRHGFTKLGLRRVHSCHYAANPESGRVILKTGLKPEGVQRGHALRMGAVHDVVQYGVLRDEWLAAFGAG
ncbi:MAG TPA: GNAT family N-acetyltransferase [Phycisphaerales bacterium]|nr:GNAT family N-acetyltransferase [Phycisphaerales bacterium]